MRSLAVFINMGQTQKAAFWRAILMNFLFTGRFLG